MKIKPIGPMVTVEVDAVREQTEKGILLPEMSRETPKRGTLRGVGSEATGLTVGERVFFTIYGANFYDDEGKSMMVTHVDQIIGVIEAE